MYKLLSILIILLAVLFGGYSLWQYGTEAATTIGSDNPSFQADLKNTLDLQAGVGGATFTRATVATVTDFEGLIKNVKSGEARFEGARRVENIITNSEATSSRTANVGMTMTPINDVPPGSNIKTAYTIDVTDSVWQWQKETPYDVNRPLGVFRSSLYVKGVGSSIGKILQFRIFSNPNGPNDATAYTNLTLTNSYQRVATPLYTPIITSADIFNQISNTGSTVTTGDTIQIAGWQMENVTGQANQNPSEYVSTGVKTATPYHGANVDGVKYFSTYNGNTVASNVVTEATGASIPDATLHGYVAEGVRTNSFKYSEVFGNSNWTASNIALSASTTAPDGKVTGVLMTAGATDSTILQAITGTAASWTMSVYLKRLIGTGVVSISADGTTFTTCTINSTTWTRCTDTRTLTVASYNGTIKLATSGDAVYAWGAQLEAGAFASTYIPTTSASVTRNADALTYPTTGNVDFNQGSAFAIYTPSDNDSIGGVIGFSEAAFLTYNGAYAGIYGYNGTSGYFYNAIPITFGVASKIASKWNSTIINASANGQIATPYSFSSPFGGNQGSSIKIGYRATVSRASGTVRNVKIWKKALTDTQLQNLTSTSDAVSHAAVKKTTVKRPGTATTTINASQNSKLTDGLVGLWSFNGQDISGTTAYDRSGQGNNGTLVGGVMKTIGKVGQAMSFDGTRGYLYNSSPNLVIGNNVFTKSVWIYSNYKGSPVNHPNIISWGDSSTNNKNGLSLQTDGFGNPQILQWFFSNDYTWNISDITGGWHHIVIIYNPTALTLYIDGVSQGTQTVTGTPSVVNSNLEIGRFGDNPWYYFDGKIDEVRIYNRALSASEVAQLYNLGR